MGMVKIIVDLLVSKVVVGIEEVDCEIGSAFDPDKHDAIKSIDMGEDKKNTIIDVVKKGYSIDGRIVKYPQVVVGK
jgi:molecular chaperone GrpE